MFASSSALAGATAVPLATAGLNAIAASLGHLPADIDDAERIDRIRLLTELESAVVAARAIETARFADSQRATQAAAGMPAERVGRGIASQVGLALRCSPARAQKYVGWARILTTELPETFAALQAGRISEWRAMIVARETIWLSRADRAQVDTELADRLEGIGDRKLEAAAKTIAYRLDPAGYVTRARAAENDRRVGLRPAPDCMSRLTTLLPVAQGVASYAALAREADAAIAAGDPRGRGQIMADTLVERVTGQARAAEVPVQINLIMTDQSLTATGPGANEPAIVDGYGPIPAALARELVLDRGEAPAWLRRLYTSAGSGQLIAMETRRREFTPAQRRFLRLRDQFCRTPWCDAPIRHADHVIPAEHGGATTIENGQGYCQACNHAKQAPGWTTTPVLSRAGPHQVDITTPTGHRYTSNAPDPPGRAA
jgi:hypothetical protein